MRKEGILDLKWDNVDLKASFILLNQDQTKNSEREEIHISPISPTLMKLLEALPERKDIPYVFY
jgi:integrase